jgi:hypothetical protein
MFILRMGRALGVVVHGFLLILLLGFFLAARPVLAQEAKPPLFAQPPVAVLPAAGAKVTVHGTSIGNVASVVFAEGRSQLAGDGALFGNHVLDVVVPLAKPLLAKDTPLKIDFRYSLDKIGNAGGSLVVAGPGRTVTLSAGKQKGVEHRSVQFTLPKGAAEARISVMLLTHRASKADQVLLQLETLDLNAGNPKKK